MKSSDAWLASSSVSRVTPNMYIWTMRLDQARSCGAISAGRPIISAIIGQVECRGVILGWWPAEVLAARHMQDLPAEPLVPEQGIHLLEASETPVAIILPHEGGRAIVEGSIEGVGVLVESGVARLGGGAAGGGVDAEGGHGAYLRLA